MKRIFLLILLFSIFFTIPAHSLTSIVSSKSIVSSDIYYDWVLLPMIGSGFSGVKNGLLINDPLRPDMKGLALSLLAVVYGKTQCLCYIYGSDSDISKLESYPDVVTVSDSSLKSTAISLGAKNDWDASVYSK